MALGLLTGSYLAYWFQRRCCSLLLQYVEIRVRQTDFDVWQKKTGKLLTFQLLTSKFKKLTIQLPAYELQNSQLFQQEEGIIKPA